MGWTKRDFINQAFASIGLATFNFDMSTQQYDNALRTLDSMLGGWNANGIRIGYPLPTSPSLSNIDADTKVPDFAVEAIYTGLALRLAVTYAVDVPADLRMLADMSYNNMANQCVVPTMERQLPRTMPRGQGTKPWRNFNNPFIRVDEDPAIDAGSDGELEFE